LLAARCAGLHSKPSKCVLIITACNLTENLVSAIRAWLIVNVLEFADIIISNSGKFLGWHLGRQGAVLSFAAPVKKNQIESMRLLLGKHRLLLLSLGTISVAPLCCLMFLSSLNHLVSTI